MITGEQGARKPASPVREETDGKGPGQGHLAGGRLHSMRRGLETEQPGHGHAVKRPAGETRGKVAAKPHAGQRHRASPRPYLLFASLEPSATSPSAGTSGQITGSLQLRMPRCGTRAWRQPGQWPPAMPRRPACGSRVTLRCLHSGRTSSRGGAQPCQNGHRVGKMLPRADPFQCGFRPH
jgi:hypothetical protein